MGIEFPDFACSTVQCHTGNKLYDDDDDDDDYNDNDEDESTKYDGDVVDAITMLPTVTTGMHLNN